MLVLVTGASTGLGLATAGALLDDGHDVVLHARREGRLEDADLARRAHAVVHADLADPDAVRGLATELDGLGRFDAVVHNAGVFSGDDVGRVNVVAPYLLTALMARPERVVLLSSSMHQGGDPRTAAASLEDPLTAGWTYQDSKLCVTALAVALAGRWPDVRCHAVDPGWVPTRMGGAHATDDLAEGHRTQVWLATAPASEVTPASGGYWYHHAARAPHPAALDPDFQQLVLRRLAEATGVELPG